MFHACVRKFDVMSTIGKFLGTKRGLIRELKTNNKDAEITVAAGVDQRTRTKGKGYDGAFVDRSLFVGRLKLLKVYFQKKKWKVLPCFI